MSSDAAAPLTTAAPSVVRLHQRSRRLELSWPNGQGVSLGHAQLRQACRCAWCQRTRAQGGHPVSPDVTLHGVTPVGDVGLQLHFSDGHDRGIYPWDYLRSLVT